MLLRTCFVLGGGDLALAVAGCKVKGGSAAFQGRGCIGVNHRKVETVRALPLSNHR